jgi:hypothetical protein
MKRIVMSGLGVLLLTAVVGVMGCDGGGIEPGMPKDTGGGVDVGKMADMTKSPKTPPATPPATGAPAPATPEK